LLPQQTGILLSCAPGEFSFEHRSLGSGHGAFFFEIIEGLKGAAKDEDGDVTWESLRAFVRKRVPIKVKELYGKSGGEQNPNEIGNLIGSPTVLAQERRRAGKDGVTREEFERMMEKVSHELKIKKLEQKVEP
jgi:hypothetical protein